MARPKGSRDSYPRNRRTLLELNGVEYIKKAQEYIGEDFQPLMQCTYLLAQAQGQVQDMWDAGEEQIIGMDESGKVSVLDRFQATLALVDRWIKVSEFFVPKLKAIEVRPGSEAGECEQMSDIEALSKLTGILALAMERKAKGILPDNDGNFRDE